MRKINYKYSYIYNDFKATKITGLKKNTTKILKNPNQYNIYSYKYVHIYKIKDTKQLDYIQTVKLDKYKPCDVKPFIYEII